MVQWFRTSLLDRKPNFRPISRNLQIWSFFYVRQVSNLLYFANRPTVTLFFVPTLNLERSFERQKMWMFLVVVPTSALISPQWRNCLKLPEFSPSDVIAIHFKVVLHVDGFHLWWNQYMEAFPGFPIPVFLQRFSNCLRCVYFRVEMIEPQWICPCYGFYWPLLRFRTLGR